jgi:hypothetical protein
MRRHTSPVGQDLAGATYCRHTTVSRPGADRPRLAALSGDVPDAVRGGDVSVAFLPEDERTLVLPCKSLASRASRGGHGLPGPPRDARDGPRTAAGAANRAVPSIRPRTTPSPPLRPAPHPSALGAGGRPWNPSSRRDSLSAGGRDGLLEAIVAPQQVAVDGDGPDALQARIPGYSVAWRSLSLVSSAVTPAVVWRPIPATVAARIAFSELAGSGSGQASGGRP